MKTPSILAFTTSTRGSCPKEQLRRFLQDLPKMSEYYCFTKLEAGRYHGKSGRANMGFALIRIDKALNKQCEKISTDYLGYKDFEENLEID